MAAATIDNLEEGEDKMLKLYGDSDDKNHWKQGDFFRREQVHSCGLIKEFWLQKKKFCKHNIDQFARQATNHET